MPTDWCGTGAAWTNTNSPWCGVGAPWSNTNPSWCGAGVPFGCTLPVLASGSCVGSVQEFWFTAGNPPFDIYQSGSFLFTVNNLNVHFNIACGTEWCSVIPASAIDKCKINTTISPGGITLAGIISCTGACDETIKSTTKQYTYTPCYCGSGTAIWAVSGTGASISQSGLLTTTAAACGTLTITVTYGGCTVATQQVRVTDGGVWVVTSNICSPGCGVPCDFASNSFFCSFISGGTKIYYQYNSFSGQPCSGTYGPCCASSVPCPGWEGALLGCDPTYPTGGQLCAILNKTITYEWRCP